MATGIDSLKVIGNGLAPNDGTGDTLRTGASIINANSAAIKTAINRIASSQAGGAISYLTKADMDADLEHPDGTIAWVTNDPVDTNNQAWRKTGDTGTGDWEITVDRMAAVLGNGAGFQQSGTGASVRTFQDKMREIKSVADFPTFAQAIAAKSGNTTAFRILPNVAITLTSSTPVSDYILLAGDGDQSQIKLAENGTLVYSRTNTWDDHPHATIKDFRITGDGIFAAYPSAQNGTTIGYQNSAGGSFARVEGMTFESHSVGRWCKNAYVNISQYNHYRANKIGLLLDGVSSFSEKNSYFRFNSDAAIKITGATQNVTIQGGAIEGNPGPGILITGIPSNSNLQIILDDVYMESNGNFASGVPAVQNDFTNDLCNILVRGGSYANNVNSGVTNGIFQWGNRVTFQGSLLAGTHYATHIGFDAGTRLMSGIVVNTPTTQAGTAGLTLVPPAMLHSWNVREYASVGTGNGLVFQVPITGLSARKYPITNVATMAYPHASAPSGGSRSEDTSLDYGDGSWTKLSFAASAGSFSSNYSSLFSFVDPDSSYPFKICVFLVHAYTSTDIGLVASQSSPALQTVAGFYHLEAGETYKIITIAARSGSGNSILRMFPIGSDAPNISFLPIYGAQFSSHSAATGFVARAVAGEM